MMKRTLAITTAALALSLAGCSADLGAGGMDAYRTRSAETVPATDSVYNGNAFGPNSSLTGTGGVAGAMNRAAGGDSAGSAYTATNNGGFTAQDRREARSRYQLMLENGRVHDTDGYLLDGENAHYRTF